MALRRRSNPRTPEQAEVEATAEVVTAAEVDTVSDSPIPAESSDRSLGPWDVTEVSDETERLDFGGLRFTAREGLELQVQVDQQTGRVLFVTAVLGQAAAQVHVFAAPRSAGIWPDVRAEIRAGIIANGGLVEEADGPFGPELRARVAQTPGAALQPARFVGVDGPRWFLRAILLGDAAIPGPGARAIEDVVREVVVVRGDSAMAPREQIPLHVPGQDNLAPASGIDPFVRGPEITEVR